MQANQLDTKRDASALLFAADLADNIARKQSFADQRRGDVIGVLRSEQFLAGRHRLAGRETTYTICVTATGRSLAEALRAASMLASDAPGAGGPR
jgi:hypothetical protein